MKAQAGVNLAFLATHPRRPFRNPLAGLTAQPQLPWFPQQGEGAGEGRALFIIRPVEEVIAFGEYAGLLAELIEQLGNALILLVQPPGLLLNPFHHPAPSIHLIGH